MVFVLVAFTVIYSVVILIGLASFPLVPSFFGVYGPSKKTIRAKLILFFICCFPLVVVVSSYVSFRYQNLVSQFAIFLPMAYLLLIWVIRENKQDGRGAGKRFSRKQDNIREQLRELEYKLPSIDFENLERLTIEVEACFLSKNNYFGFAEEISSGSNVLEKPSLENAEGDNLYTLRLLNRKTTSEDLRLQIVELVDLAWKHDGEVFSVEFE